MASAEVPVESAGCLERRAPLVMAKARGLDGASSDPAGNKAPLRGEKKRVREKRGKRC